MPSARCLPPWSLPRQSRRALPPQRHSSCANSPFQSYSCLPEISSSKGRYWSGQGGKIPVRLFKSLPVVFEGIRKEGLLSLGERAYSARACVSSFVNREVCKRYPFRVRT